MSVKHITDYPITGNLVDNAYIIKCNIPGLSREMPCKTVVLNGSLDDLVENGTEITGLILSEKELCEAHTRYVRKSNAPEPLIGVKKNIGRVYAGSFVSSNKNKRTSTLLIAHFIDNGIVTGYMFTQSEMNDIVARTRRIPETVKRLTLFQRIVLWLYKLIW